MTATVLHSPKPQKQSHYLRDPDSLIIESVNKCTQQTLSGVDHLVFVVYYRAKNAFAGYVKNKAWIVCEADGGKLKVLNDAAYTDFWQRATETPAAPLARGNPKESISELKSMMQQRGHDDYSGHRLQCLKRRSITFMVRLLRDRKCEDSGVG